MSKKIHSSILAVSLWSLTTIHWLTAQAATYRLWKLPAHFEIHNAEEKARQPRRLCGEQRQARKEGGRAGGSSASSEKPGGETGAAAEGAGRASRQKRAKSPAWPPDELPGGSPPALTTPGD